MSSGGQGQLRLTGGRKLRSPKGGETRPTTARVREAVINILGPRLDGAHWLDLCSGSGVMGCEALQRGAQRVVAIEAHGASAAICRSNLIATASGQPDPVQVVVVQRDLVTWLKRGRPADDPGFDLVYFDPPYSSGLYGAGLDALISGQWLRPDAVVLCEHTKTKKPATPNGWREVDQRHYGNSSVLFLSPLEHCPGDTDSKLQRTDPTR